MTVSNSADKIAETRQRVDQLWKHVDPDHLDERLAAARDLLWEARQIGEDPLVASAWRLFLVTLLEAEHVAEIDVTLGELHAYCCLENTTASREVLAWFRGLRAVLDGDPDQAEALLASSLPPRERLGPLTVIRCFQGRLDELEPLYLEMRREDPRPVNVITLAWLWAKQGRVSAARGTVDTIAPLSTLPRDRDWLFGLSLLAELSILFNDRALATAIHGTLLPYSKRIVLVGNGTGCWGSVDRPLGLLCWFLGRFEEAAQHFTAKIELSAAAGAHPWLARSQLDLAELLMDTEHSAAPRRDTILLPTARASEAVRNAREGIAAVRRLNYPMLEKQANELEHKLRTRGLLPDAPSGAARERVAHIPAAQPRVQVLGRFLVTSIDGETASWTSRKASQLLCILIAYRGRSVSRETLMEHLWPGESPTRLRNRLAVAISTVRTSLDPSSNFDREKFVSTTRETVRIQRENLHIDAEEFLAAARAALASSTPTETALSHAIHKYAGDAYSDEPYSDWASSLRDECRAMQIALLHAIIDTTTVDTTTSSVRRAELARNILDLDPYDDRAHHVLVEALDRLGARGLATASRERFEASLN